ncbi:MAG TPA: HAMP domain-containing sensor histidine kinase [Polyangiaceae bacterium]|nr:HAMP domain-containing sensor histidine kinase [Polyangiaceae bacterium]
MSPEKLRDWSNDWSKKMSERQRRWSWWAAKGAVAMALLAALSLAVTVLFAQRALDNAADVVVRGDGDTLVAGVVVDLSETGWPVTAEALAPVLAKHEAQRLRYVALVDRQDHHVLAAAGTPAIAKPFDLPGEVVREGRRVRVVDALARLYARTDRPRDLGFPRPYLVLEFEPPVIEGLQSDLTRISIVAAVAALGLIAFAFALSRTTARLAAVQQQAERERRLVALGRASSVIAHELRNPLAALKGHAQLLVEDLAGPSRAKAARVVDGAERLELLTSVLLDFVRDGPLDVRAITPAELVDRALLGLPKDRVRVDSATHTHALKELHVDAERVALALRNLLQNALQATADEGAAVELRIEGGAHEVVIEVRDHGPGLASGIEAQIFDPFVTTKTRGTGLGLSIARRIAEQHRGSLTGETHSQGGAVFRLVLPLD